MSNQDINVSGENNVIRVLGSGSLHVGNQSVEVSGEGNSVVVASGGDLVIGGKNPVHRKKAPPEVKRGQEWGHKTLPRHYKIIRVRDDVALCQLLRTNGKPFVRDGKPIIEERSVINVRYGWDLVREATNV